VKTPRTKFARQRGASLVIGLVLLLILSVLAVSTMSSATFGLTMAGNAQYGENAFQMAETGVEVAINSGPFSDQVDTVVPQTNVADLDGDQIGTFQATASFQECRPADGFSVDEYAAYHFQIDSTGTSFRGAQSQNQQDFYVVGPKCL
jgi:hypothetical protein